MIQFNEIVILDAKPTPKAERHIQQCVDENVCLCGCGQPMLKRGLAANCYYAWKQEMNALPTKSARAKYCAALIKRGRLLAEQAIRKYRKKNIFSRVAKEVA